MLLSIRDFPDELVGRLKVEAWKTGRTLRELVIETLGMSLGTGAMNLQSKDTMRSTDTKKKAVSTAPVSYVSKTTVVAESAPLKIDDVLVPRKKTLEEMNEREIMLAARRGDL